MQVRMLGLDPHQRRRQASGQSRLDCTDLQASMQSRTTDQGVGHFIIGGKDTFGPFNGQVPGLGQADLASATVKQADLQLFLQATDMQADRRGGQAEDVGGTGEGTVASDGDQGAQGFERQTRAPIMPGSGGSSWRRSTLIESTRLRLAVGLGNPVDHHCQRDYRQPGFHALADIQGLNPRQHIFAQATGADHRGNHHHRQGHHHRLIEPGHDAGHGQWQHDPAQALPASGTQPLGGLGQGRIDL
ncbi:hypothetical protein D3C72_1561490 [compost metagenome]